MNTDHVHSNACAGKPILARGFPWFQSSRRAGHGAYVTSVRWSGLPRQSPVAVDFPGRAYWAWSGQAAKRSHAQLSAVPNR